MVDWAYVNGMGEDGGDPDLEHHDPAGHCGAQVFRGVRGVYRPPLKCNRCGAAGLYWQSTPQGYRVHNKDDLTPHTCKPSASDMPDLSKD